MLNEIFKAHPKSSIIFFKFRFQNLLYIRCPKSTLFTPSSIPFEVTPQISNINQFMIIDFFYLYYGIGVSRLKYLLSFLNWDCICLFNFSWCSCWKEIFILLEAQQQFEEITRFQELLTLWIMEVINNSWEPSKILESFIWMAWFHTIIASMQFCICLFKKLHPKFIAMCSCKEWRSSQLARHIIIYGKFLPDTIFINLHSISTVLFEFFSNKQTFN